MAPATLAQLVPCDEYGVVIGIDTHQDFHVAAALASNGGKLDEIRIPTVRKGYEALVGWTELFGSRPVFAMEGSSSFGAGLCRELLAAGFAVVEANRPDRCIRRRKGKDDSIDADVAARSFLAATAMATPKSGAEHVEMIRMLKIAKDSAIDCRTCAATIRQAAANVVDPGMHQGHQPDSRHAGDRTTSSTGASVRSGAWGADGSKTGLTQPG